MTAGKAITMFPKKLLLVCIGSILYGSAVSLFLEPNQLAPGGVAGISIILNYLTHIPTGLFVFLLNVPLLLLGLWKLGKSFFLWTLLAIFLSSSSIELFAAQPPLSQDLLLSALAGGCTVAVGLGLVFKGGATTGGTDIIVRLVKLKYKHLKTGRIFLLVDSVIVFCSGLVFKNIDIVLYASLTLFCSSYVLDLVLYGKDGAKLIYVITQKPNDIADTLMKSLEIGVTYLDGIGAYTNQPKQIIMAVMRKQLLPKAEEMVRCVDKNAFMIITSANEVFGEGFKMHGPEN